jgi:hypothetical protein
VRAHIPSSSLTKVAFVDLKDFPQKEGYRIAYANYSTNLDFFSDEVVCKFEATPQLILPS